MIPYIVRFLSRATHVCIGRLFCLFCLFLVSLCKKFTTLAQLSLASRMEGKCTGARKGKEMREGGFVSVSGGGRIGRSLLARLQKGAWHEYVPYPRGIS